MPRSYSFEYVKNRILDALMHAESGLSGVELAEKTGINRVTITKYLNILESMGLVKRKYMGNVNLWYILHGLDLTTKSMLDIQQAYINALLSYDEIRARTVIVNALHDSGTGIIEGVIAQSINTVNEFYSKRLVNIVDVMIINNIILETLDAVKFNMHREEKNAYVVFLNLGDGKYMVSSRLLYTLFYLKGWRAYFIGTVSLSDIGLFFDIELVKTLNRILKGVDRSRYVTILALSISSLEPMVVEFIRSVKEKLGNIFILLNGDKDNETKVDYRYIDHYSYDIKDSVEWAERLYNRFNV